MESVCWVPNNCWVPTHPVGSNQLPLSPLWLLNRLWKIFIFIPLDVSQRLKLFKYEKVYQLQGLEGASQWIGFSISCKAFIGDQILHVMVSSSFKSWLVILSRFIYPWLESPHYLFELLCSHTLTTNRSYKWLWFYFRMFSWCDVLFLDHFNVVYVQNANGRLINFCWSWPEFRLNFCVF